MSKPSEKAMISARNFCGNQPEALVIALATTIDAHTAEAYEAGQKAMREIAADYVAECLAGLGLLLGVQSIRDLPTQPLKTEGDK